MVNGPDIYIPPLTRNQFTMRSARLTSISCRQRGAISGRPLAYPNWTWTRSTAVCSQTRPHYGLHPAMFSGNDSVKTL